jgi:hypothetical protein
MSNQNTKIFVGFAKDSMTVRHIEQSLDLVSESLTTAHLQQRIENSTPVQNQGNVGNAASIGGALPKQSDTRK